MGGVAAWGVCRAPRGTVKGSRATSFTIATHVVLTLHPDRPVRPVANRVDHRVEPSCGECYLAAGDDEVDGGIRPHVISDNPQRPGGKGPHPRAVNRLAFSVKDVPGAGHAHGEMLKRPENEVDDHPDLGDERHDPDRRGGVVVNGSEGDSHGQPHEETRRGVDVAPAEARHSAPAQVPGGDDEATQVY